MFVSSVLQRHRLPLNQNKGFWSFLHSFFLSGNLPPKLQLLWFPYLLTSVSSQHLPSLFFPSHLLRVWLFVTPWTAARQASLSITNSWSLLKLMPIESVMPSNHLILCHPLLLPPSIFPSVRVGSSHHPSSLCTDLPPFFSGFRRISLVLSIFQRLSTVVSYIQFFHLYRVGF